MPNIRSTKSQLQNLDMSNAKMVNMLNRNERVERSQLNQEPLKLPPEKQSGPTKTTRQNSPSSGSLEFLFPLPPSKSASTLRSPSLSPYSSAAPPTSSSAEDLRRNGNGEFAEISAHTIRRTQSAADIRNPAQMKPLPARPLECKNKQQREADIAKQRSSRPTRLPTGSPPASIKGNQKLSLFERSSSVPAVRKRPSTEESSERKERPTVKPQSTTNEDRNEATTSINLLSLDTGKQESRKRFTAEQVLWLHQNYRGEATFLKAWGLHVSRDADREQGREIMEMLMAAESKEKEQSRHQKLQNQIDRIQRETSPALEAVDKGALDIIDE
ncbi:hypothetical protein F5Y00DRAFT_264937 [Daldinia vernicosa]|uniref:uncharacterized protein n=1 Tax=Daldinia vernicosa TaxID=114800 RepID=UPI002007F480|nr:uncharacterized protein F5Y00DRAFT_264937 [Daldinia vernicosa]KAI0846043.1 hypothetical protein F5Y00DRAFT_264937 [Daldinia vernicosa]